MIIESPGDMVDFRRTTVAKMLAALKLEIHSARWVAGVDVDGGRKLLPLTISATEEQHLQQLLDHKLRIILGD